MLATGGSSVMIVDSTALLERVVRDILVAAFQTAGQSCSSLDLLYLQEDIAKPCLDLLYGAMDQLRLGDPWHIEIDIGPMISVEAKAKALAWIEKAKADGHFPY